MIDKIKTIVSRNNIYKTVHHLKKGNIGFVFSKAKQTLKDNLVSRKLRQTDYDDDIFEFMFSQNADKDKEYKNFIEHSKIEDTLRTIAFYLPQFHPIQENDDNWGKGFTEWTNVSKAIPQFKGHYQPHLPGELGFYDLRLKEIQKRQIELAKNYSIDGFCFHFYWFNGRRVLEKPLEQFVEDKSLDFPFCINWANENWTRRWDGLEGEILLEQKYSDEDDIDFIEAACELFRDARYIKVDGKPLLMIYRVSLFPDIKATVKRWRDYCHDNGIGEIYLVLTHSFEHTHPGEIGFDAAVEFSPNTFSVKVRNNQAEFYNENYNGMLFDYQDAVDYSLSQAVPAYKKFKTVFPSWDNEARKPGAGTSFIRATPRKYEAWLRKIYQYTKRHFPKSEQLVFINAWNEWAEGAHLEPDRKFGYSYLEATYNAKAFYQVQRQKIVVVTHDAYLHGAQYLALNIARELLEQHQCEVTILSNGEGPLLDKFREIGIVYELFSMSEKEKISLYQGLYNEGVRFAIANTSTVGEIVRDLKKVNISSVSLIHEMESVIRQYNLKGSLALIADNAEKVLFPSQIVKDDFTKFVALSEEKSMIQPQGLFRQNYYKGKKSLARERLRTELSLEKDTFIVLNIAYGDKRKGLDIFVQTGIEVLERGGLVDFVWGGHYEESMYHDVQKMIAKTPYRDRFHFTGFLEDIDVFYAGADLFFLSSREDPFPSVVMDAMNVGLPVIGFRGAGGFSTLLEKGQGVLVDYLDEKQVASEIVDLQKDNQRYEQISLNAKQKIEKDYDFSSYIVKLLELTKNDIIKVSVVIPNYNYVEYLESRIQSVLSQTYPIYEIIFLDDNSTDASIEVAKRVLETTSIPYKILKNDTNSGSVFKQWAKGIHIAKGDYIWIAEADDLCEVDFLESVVQGFKVPDTILSYTQSKMMDSQGKILADSYLSYTDDIDTEKWKEDYNIEGVDELTKAMVVKNVIPNVSATVFKKIELDEILDKLVSFKVAGDWFFYVWLLQQGRVSYTAKSLSLHRRHNESVTKQLDQQKHFDEIVQMQEMIIREMPVGKDALKKTIAYRKNVKKYLNV